MRPENELHRAAEQAARNEQRQREWHQRNAIYLAKERAIKALLHDVEQPANV